MINQLPTIGDSIIVRTNNEEVTYDTNTKIMHTIVEYKFLVSINSFFQINDYVTPLLYGKVNKNYVLKWLLL